MTVLPHLLQIVSLLVDNYGPGLNLLPGSLPGPFDTSGSFVFCVDLVCCLVLKSIWIFSLIIVFSFSSSMFPGND